METLWIVVVAVMAVGIIIYLVYLNRKKPSGFSKEFLDAFVDLKAVKDRVAVLEDIKTKLEVGDVKQGDIKKVLDSTKELLDYLKTESEKRKIQEAEDSKRLARLDAVMAGSYTKGESGENLLREVFKQFPQEMIVTNLQVRGKVVEFALNLVNNKKLPIDSKWTAAPLLQELEAEDDPAKRLEIVEAIDKEVTKRVKEVTQYIEPPTTVPWAIAAIPDAAFSVCRKAHLEAHNNRVILMSYSLAIPYILSFYGLHLQYSRSVDMENLQSYLANISTNLDQMEQVLQHKIARGSTMISNAYDDYRLLIGQIRGSIAALQAPSQQEQGVLGEQGVLELREGRPVTSLFEQDQF